MLSVIFVRIWTIIGRMYVAFAVVVVGMIVDMEVLVVIVVMVVSMWILVVVVVMVVLGVCNTWPRYVLGVNGARGIVDWMSLAWMSASVSKM